MQQYYSSKDQILPQLLKVNNHLCLLKEHHKTFCDLSMAAVLQNLSQILSELKHKSALLTQILRVATNLLWSSYQSPKNLISVLQFRQCSILHKLTTDTGFILLAIRSFNLSKEGTLFHEVFPHMSNISYHHISSQACKSAEYEF